MSNGNDSIEKTNPALSAKAEKFRQGIRAISQSAEAVLHGLRTEGAVNRQLDLQLAGLLKDLRQQRTYSMDLAMGLPPNPQFDAYINSLGMLRGMVAQWLTIYAANPHAIEVEATDFEMQCFSTLGAGVVWLDGLHSDAQRDSLLSDEQMLSFVFGAEQAQGEDITEQIEQLWSKFTTQPGLVS
ncbi:MAG: hypothetical protein ACKO1L_04305 [Brachymonas sp.]